IPSFEEELQQLSTCLSRVERALDKHDFEAMRPEFLLRTALNLRSRLNQYRSNLQPGRALQQGELPPLPVAGCISRTESEIPDGDEITLASSPSPILAETGGPSRQSQTTAGEAVPASPLRGVVASSSTGIGTHW